MLRSNVWSLRNSYWRRFPSAGKLDTCPKTIQLLYCGHYTPKAEAHDYDQQESDGEVTFLHSQMYALADK